MVGSVIPTSSATVHTLLNGVDWTQAQCVVEYGPGTGVFTRELLHRIGPEARLIAIDTSPQFIDLLRREIDDERLICVEGSASDVERILARNGFDRADYIISGLPFSVLPPGVADAIMDATARAITPGGGFLVYQYSRFVLPFLRHRFGQVQSRLAMRCFPPARLFWAWKAPDRLSSAAGESLAAASRCSRARQPADTEATR